MKSSQMAQKSGTNLDGHKALAVVSLWFHSFYLCKFDLIVTGVVRESFATWSSPEKKSSSQSVFLESKRATA